MHHLYTRILHGIRKSYLNVSRLPNPHQPLKPDYVGQTASDFIKTAIASNQPCMIARLGSGELEVTLRHLHISDSRDGFSKFKAYMRGEIDSFWWDDRILDGMSSNAGFFPATEEYLTRFGDRMLRDISNIDILGSWLAGEAKVAPFFPNATIVPLETLEPYYHPHPWSEVLQDKVVLVIHPFEQSIRSQYNKRTLLFNDLRVLPHFELKTLKAVQSIANTQVQFSSWFEALESMCEQVNQIDFDVAIIGAGAYGLPLAAYIKRIGKQAIHLGGATQILFGIKGKRWDDRPFFQQLYNQHWTRPSTSEVPTNAQVVEGGCYW